jgi:hypothetical protein
MISEFLDRRRARCGVSHSWLLPLFKRPLRSSLRRLLKAGGGLENPTPLQAFNCTQKV